MEISNIYTYTENLNEFTEEFLNELLDIDTYNTNGSAVGVAAVLKILKQRIDNGETIFNKATPENNTFNPTSFKNFVKEKFGLEMVSMVYKDNSENSRGLFSFPKFVIGKNSDVHNIIENTPEGLALHEKVYGENNAPFELFRNIASVNGYTLVELTPTHVVYIKNEKNGQIIPFISEHNSIYVYDPKTKGIFEVFN